MLRLQTPLADRYRDASPDELDEMIATAYQATSAFLDAQDGDRGNDLAAAVPMCDPLRFAPRTQT